MTNKDYLGGHSFVRCPKCGGLLTETHKKNIAECSVCCREFELNKLEGKSK